MKFSCDAEAFQKVLSGVQWACAKNNTLPVLEHVLVRASGTEVELSATDLEVSLRASVPAKVENEGATTVPLKLLLSWLGLSSGEGKELSVARSGEKERFLVQCGNAKTTLSGISADDFPALPEVERRHDITFSADVFKKVLARATFAAASSGVRPVLSGLFFSFDGSGNNVIVGTDSYRLSELSVAPDAIEGEVSAIVPARAMTDVERLLSAASKDIRFVFGDNQVDVFFGGFQLTSRLIEGNFPEYSRIIPKEFSGKVAVSRKEFLRAIRQASVFAFSGSGSVKIAPTGTDLVRIFTEENEVGSGESAVESNNTGEVPEVLVSVQYLLDAVMAFGGDDLVLQFGGALTPIVLSSASDDGFLHLVMPLKG